MIRNTARRQADSRALLRARRRASAGGFLFPIWANSGASSSFDPTTLSLEGYWRASWGGSPWSPTASAGGSGNSLRTLTEASNPPAVGAAVNGLTPADFDGTNDVLNTSVTLNTFVGSFAGTLWVLFNADVASLPQGGGSTAEPYEQPGIVSTAGSGYWILGYNTDGVVAASNDGAYKAVTRSAATGGWRLAQMRIGSSQLELRVNGGAWSSVAFGSIGSRTSTIVVGSNYNGTRFFNGKILEIAFAPTALSDATLDNVRTYCGARYGVSV
jgi:hypothetical protein